MTPWIKADDSFTYETELSFEKMMKVIDYHFQFRILSSVYDLLLRQHIRKKQWIYDNTMNLWQVWYNSVCSF